MSTEMFREESKLWTHWPVGKYHSNIFVQLIETAEILFKISKTYDDANQFQFDKFLTLTREKKIVTSHETSIKHRTSLHAVQFTEYLENVVSIHTRVSKIAKALNVSAKYLTEICHREFQLPPSVLVRDAIVRKAKKLLKETDKPIKEIAEDLGFVDTAHFCRTFKKVSGFRSGDFR
jgi:AraC-like DNA-binding protein